MRPRRRRPAALPVVLLVAALVTGCTTTTLGTASPAPKGASGTVTGPAIKRALLDGPRLTTMLNQPFEAVPHFSHLGGAELLDDRSGSPAECVGVVFRMQRSDYQSADVKNIADEGWAHGGRAVKVDMVVEDVAALPTAGVAAALFAKLSDQWKRCDGTTMTDPSDIWSQNAISDVRVTDSVAAATVSRRAGEEHPILTAIPEAHALGVRGNCLVEVNVIFSPVSYPGDEGSADIATSAVDVAHAIMDRLDTAH
ncbi:sensor domain-containing protein [Mycobacterium sp. Marseille-P9652]|uniref:sensor domain-containing protein n=1 Tax=Mycobacterium sp. Marseille-P9652 TaxID=2654950 RepID=UPI0012E88280|nr:sensor domain-containing protein [Mycobacterium sp. Marseille-P9652]